MNRFPSLRRTARWSLSVAVVATAAALLTGCVTSTGASPTGASESSGEDEIKIGFVPAIYPHPYFLTMERELMAQAEGRGYTVVLQGAPEYSPEAQVPILQSLLASDLDALIVAPTDTEALNSALAQYKSKGIPVFLVDAGISDPDLVVSTIQTDNYQGGATAADTLADAIGGAGTVAIESFEPGSGAGAPRVEGFLDRMAEAYPDITVLDPQYGKNDVSLSATHVSAALLAHPELAGVFGANTASANGAGQAVKTAGKTGEVIVVGYDAGPEEIANVRSGLFDMTIAQHPAEEAALAVKAIEQYFDGDRGAIEKEITTGVTVVTRDNIGDPEVMKYFYTD